MNEPQENSAPCRLSAWNNGAGWPHGDGEAFNMKLDYLPLKGAKIVIRKPKVDAVTGEAA